MNLWGVHNNRLTVELVDEGFISVGWDFVPDLNTITGGRDGFKEVIRIHEPESHPMSIANQAGVLFRFRDEMKIGDIVVAPYRPDSTINIGVVTSDYYCEAGAPTHRHRRRVDWKRVGVSRTVFSSAALYEIGSAITLFAIRKHAEEFLAALSAPETDEESVARAVEQVVVSSVEDDSPDEPSASRIERHTRDFVLNALHRNISHRDFEEFTADLMRTLGYEARVTPYSNDGGVDVIAHRDPLGVEPPLIKIQCKHHTGSIGSPDVAKLTGVTGRDELCVFVTLGNYSKDARAVEHLTPGLRLLSGEDVVSLVLKNYDRLDERWRQIIPLRSVLVVADDF